MGKKPWEKAVHNLSEPNSALQMKALKELADMKASECIADILKLTTSKDDDVKLEAIITLGKIGDPKAGDEIAKFLAEKNDIPVLMEAITALGRLGAAGYTKAADAILPMLDHPNLRVRKFTIYALGLCGNEKSIEALVKFFPNEDTATEIKEEAAIAIGQIGGSKAIEVLTRLVLPDEKTHVLSREIRRAAIVALGDAKSPAALEVLAKVYAVEEDKMILKYTEQAIQKTIEGARMYYQTIKERAEKILKSK